MYNLRFRLWLLSRATTVAVVVDVGGSKSINCRIYLVLSFVFILTASTDTFTAAAATASVTAAPWGYVMAS